MELECKHKFDGERVCIKCALEGDPILIPRISFLFYKKKRPKQNDMETIKDLTDLCLDPDVTSAAYEMYQQVMENKIYQSKMRKIILCACVCIALGDCDVQHLNYFNNSEKYYKKGIKKLTFNRRLSIKSLCLRFF